jgi:uncharacterized protein
LKVFASKEEDMEVFSKYLAGIDNPDHRERTKEILAWVANKFPNLEPQIKWNTPMFSDHGTYIIGFSTAKHHLSVAPEEVTMVKFADDIKQASYSDQRLVSNTLERAGKLRIA